MRIHFRLPTIAVFLAAFLLGVLCTLSYRSKTGRRIVARITRSFQEQPQFILQQTNREFAYKIPEYYDDQQLRGVRSPQHPIWAVRRGLEVKKIAGGFTFPVNIAFAETQDDAPDAPTFYISELHGKIKYLARNGSVYTYADGLTNHVPLDVYSSDETGVIGLACLPDSHDLVITTAHVDSSSGLLMNRIVRLISKNGGRAMKEAQVILDLKEFTSPSHQIHQIMVGPDGKLYVSVGDGHNFNSSLDLERFAGKLLRMNLDGTPCRDNPFFKDHPRRTPSQYVYALGLRNMFDFDFHPVSQRLYGVDNGPAIDRLVEIVRGGTYGWDGLDDSMRVNSLFTWGPKNNLGPAGLAILKKPTLGKETEGQCYVAMASNPVERAGQSIWECLLDPTTGMLARSPGPVLKYIGKAKTTVVGLAEGPDGLYFTDFFGESEGTGNESNMGNVWKLYPTDDTLNLPPLQETHPSAAGPVTAGRLLFQKHCTTCHRMEGAGGTIGPNLTHVARNLNSRLTSNGYVASVKRLLRSESSFSKQQHFRLEQVINTPAADERVRIWLHHHLLEPRFDNLFARMPSFSQALTKKQRTEIIDFLMTRH